MSYRPTSAIKQISLGYGDYLRFRDLVLAHSGLYFPDKKRIDLELGLAKAMAESPLVDLQNGEYNLENYYQLLSNDQHPQQAAEINRLINMLTIGETYFFRDAAQFNALANHVLPSIIKKKRAAAKAVGLGVHPQLRIWSAGCASGEEPYSLAMLLKELLPDIANWNVLILATDINQNSLERAKEGIYSNWSFRENRAKLLRSRHFTQLPPSASTGNAPRYQLSNDIRRMVSFASLNLTDDIYPAIYNNTVSMDLILCRNVTIYFTEAITKQVVKRFYSSLVEDGWLVVGHSEPSIITYRDFQARVFPDTLIYQKTGKATSWPKDWATLEQSTAPSLSSPAGLIKPVSSVQPPRNGTTANNNLSGPSLFKPKTPPAPLHPQSALDTPADREKVYQSALLALNNGNLAKAIEQLQKIIEADPNHAASHSLLGRAYANKGDWARARQWCERALQLDNLLAETHQVLALVHDHEENYDAAISSFKKAIYLDRNAPVAQFNLAMLYRRQGQLKNARRSLQNAIRILEKWPVDAIVPDTGGATAKHLLETARTIARSLA